MADKSAFFAQLAAYLVDQQVKMSIRLEVDPGDPEARQWCLMRQATPLFGYPTVAEAEAQLRDWLGA